jgi:WD40 repeat protein
MSADWEGDYVDENQDVEEIELEEGVSGPLFGTNLHAESVFSVCFHPVDESVMASGGADEVGFLWREEEVKRIEGHTDSVVSVSFSADGSLLASAGMDGFVRVWDYRGNCVRVLEGPSAEIEWMEWHPHGKVIVAGSVDSVVWMWNAVTGDVMQTFSGHSGTVNVGGFDRQSARFVLSAGEDGTLVVWRPKTGGSKCIVGGVHFHTSPITSLDSAPTAPIAATGSEDGQVFITHLESGKVLARPVSFQEPVEAIAFSRSGQFLAAGDMEGNIAVIDSQPWTVRVRMKHEDGIVRLRWHPVQEEILVSASLDMSLRVWDVRNGACIRTFKGHQEPILDLAISRSGRRVASCCEDGYVLVYGLSEE